MKTILLTTTALVAFAGAAAAEVSFGGSADLSYNDSAAAGFTSDATLDVTMSRELDNGLTASATVSVDVEANGGVALTSADYVLSLSSDTASLSYGDVDPVAAAAWDGAGVDGSVFGDFDEVTAGDAVLAATATFGNTTASVSYGVDLGAGELSEMQVGVTSTFGAATVALAYQDADHDGHDDVAFANDNGTPLDLSDDYLGDDEFAAGELLGVSVSTAVAGADVTLAMLTDMTDNSFGVDVSYPMGAVTLGGYYTVNSNAAADNTWGVDAAYDNGNGVTAGVEYDSTDAWEVSAGYAMDAMSVSGSFNSDDEFAADATYDMGNGVTLEAGIADSGNDQYFGVEYALGEGATAYASYATADDLNGDEDIDAGTTVGLSFTF